MKFPVLRWVAAAAVSVLAVSAVSAQTSDVGGSSQQVMSAAAAAQIVAVRNAKLSLNYAQRKLQPQLAFGLLKAAADSRVSSFRGAIESLPVALAAAPGVGGKLKMVSGVRVHIHGAVTDDLVNAVNANGGVVHFRSDQHGAVYATVPQVAVERLAARADVRSIKLPPAKSTNVGSITAQGYISHEANKAVAMGYNGAGVCVGVLSDSASDARVAALIASRDLPAGSGSLPGQSGGSQSDEGAAMMEIVADVAPGATLKFATAFDGPESFAANIIALADAGCRVIVDDVSYFEEGAFQDDVIARAVNTVVDTKGVIYFSSAANSGNLTLGTSGTWEGDFADGGEATGVLLGAGTLHKFGAQAFNSLTAATPFVSLKWSDALGQSSNDYDIYVLNSTGTGLLGFSAGVQDGTQDPSELAFRNAGFPVGARVVVVKFSGEARALRVDTHRGKLQIATAGSTYGHNAADKANSIAATYWNSAKTGTRPFTGAANRNESFSSDGPRKIFYQPDGTPITPGNFLFGTNGGQTLQKPDFAAADGVSTVTPGFQPFFGTSAAAPHAAGIAALVLQARPTFTPAQVKQALICSALDSMGGGVDRDSGYGIVMAKRAIDCALAQQQPQ